MAADPLSRLSGLSATSEWIAGAALVGYGVALYLAAGVPNVQPRSSRPATKDGTTGLCCFELQTNLK